MLLSFSLPFAAGSVGKGLFSLKEMRKPILMEEATLFVQTIFLITSPPPHLYLIHT
jgi:hypothetical protein